MIKAEIVADSLSPQGDRLISVLCTFPRFILAEVNTHRMLSKNTSSSRAIPFNKMVEAVQNNPFIPMAWQIDHKGMQGNEYLEGIYAQRATDTWLNARNNAIAEATQLNKGTSVTKQLCNRLLEPFMWTTMLITGSKEGWDNFFELRCPQYQTPVSQTIEPQYSWKDLIENHSNPTNLKLLEDNKDNILFKLQHNKGQAEIHMMDLAEKIYDAMNKSTPKQLQAGEWHIPFKSKMELNNVKAVFPYQQKEINKHVSLTKVKISTAMAARTSYTVVGEEKEIDYEKMIGLYDRLVSQDPSHSSPLEHAARAMTKEEYKLNVKGELNQHEGYIGVKECSKGWCRNFKGFIQLRHLVENGENI